MLEEDERVVRLPAPRRRDAVLEVLHVAYLDASADELRVGALDVVDAELIAGRASRPLHVGDGWTTTSSFKSMLPPG